jgi:hypothetical protein
MWLAQFVCAPQFFKTPKGLCGHTVLRTTEKQIKRTTVLTVALTLRGEYRLRVLEKRVLRKIFGPKRDEVTGEWRRLHNEELNDLYSSPNIFRVIKSRRMRWAGHVARTVDGGGAHRILFGRPEGRRPFGRTRRRLKDNIKMDLQEVGWRGMNWIDLAQDSDKWRALVNVVMNLRVPQMQIS